MSVLAPSATDQAKLIEASTLPASHSDAVVVEVQRDAPPLGWDQFVQQSPVGNIHQTTHMAEFYRHFCWARPVYLRCLSDTGHLLGQLLAFDSVVRSSMLHAGGRGHRVLHGIGRCVAKRIWWRGGPLVIDSPRGRQVFAALLEAVGDYGQRNGAVCVEGAFPLGCDEDHWRGLDCTIAARELTVVLDTDRAVDPPSAPLHRSARKNVRNALKAGAYVDSYPENPNLLGEYIEAMAAEGSMPRPRARCILSTFAERLGPQFRLFMAKDAGGRPLAGITVLHFGQTAGENARFTAGLAYESRIAGGDLVQSQIAVWCREHGIKSFDLAGVEPNPRSEKELAIRKYKGKFGTTVPVPGYFRATVQWRASTMDWLLRKLSPNNRGLWPEVIDQSEIQT